MNGRDENNTRRSSRGNPRGRIVVPSRHLSAQSKSADQPANNGVYIIPTPPPSSLTQRVSGDLPNEPSAPYNMTHQPTSHPIIKHPSGGYLTSPRERSGIRPISSERRFVARPIAAPTQTVHKSPVGMLDISALQAEGGYRQNQNNSAAPDPLVSSGTTSSAAPQSVNIPTAQQAQPAAQASAVSNTPINPAKFSNLFGPSQNQSEVSTTESADNTPKALPTIPITRSVPAPRIKNQPNVQSNVPEQTYNNIASSTLFPTSKSQNNVVTHHIRQKAPDDQGTIGPKPAPTDVPTKEAQANNNLGQAFSQQNSTVEQFRPTNSQNQAAQNKAENNTNQTDNNQQFTNEQYLSAWQNYYQKYYESYYVAALQQQKQKFAQQKAEVVDSRENDGTLSQTEVQQRISNNILSRLSNATGKAKERRWFWPVVAAVIVMLIFLLLQYNSVISAKVAAFISPGMSSSQTIIVGTGANTPVSYQPRVIIPKINVNAPVTYGLTNLSEDAVQAALQNGPVNYPVAGATAKPGQKGNVAILGHSSADFFAKGNYKFIFVQLNRLTQDDLFYLDYGKTRYTYKVKQIKVINPNEVSQLNLGTSKNYATLVTCDPPGTIEHRLLVIGEQVSPNPDGATVETSKKSSNQPTKITGKPKTLLENIFGK